MNNNSQELDSLGYTILKNTAPMELISSIQSYAQEFLKCEKNSSSIIEAMSQLEILDKKKFYSFCIEMGKILPATQIASISPILSLVKGVLKTENIYLPEAGIFFNKIDVTRLQYDWHTEKSYFPNANEVITLWYPWLHNVNVDNGTMIMADASHTKMHTAETIHVKDGLTQMKIKETDLEEFHFTPCTLELGDVVLFKLNTVHKTGVNKSGIPRTTMITRLTNYSGITSTKN
jgi:ectoine hydroxylase-related dioxygenase (phytanoyl-CoA dioxygenase family)|tara:strand:- start:5248 stop:5946 length:699 start_codon:yes stop_codon:yes gene_type:complete